MHFLVEVEEQPQLPGLGSPGWTGNLAAFGRWRPPPVWVCHPPVEAGEEPRLELLGSSGCFSVSFRGHSHSRSASRASHCPQGWDKHGPKRNLCARHY